MNPLSIADFECYFRELHGYDPYDWQTRLAERVIDGNWPGAIDLPTGSGKTACIDVAVFALACQATWEKSKRTAPRRIFFCVNRRVIVDEAHQRAKRIAEAIWNAEADVGNTQPTLRRVAAALRHTSGTTKPNIPPLDVLELRGGIYRDNRWARSATQPTIICTTIDQLGSRLLFRGYGVSPNAAPIQAALIAYDSMVFLDEAHISRPFLQTLGFATRYLDPEKWADKNHRLGINPMILVPMTATPPDGVSETDLVRLTEQDRTNEGLDKRLKARKDAKLLLSKTDLVDSAVSEAERLSIDSPTAVGIIVNRVATAKAIYERLRKTHLDVELVIGSMRPIDRDQQAERLRDVVGPKRPIVTTKTSFIVATQCLEVGADYDFDVLVTECASLDALRQRFGRLNRGGRDIAASASVLMSENDISPKKPDPIYGDALPATWNWLMEHASVTIASLEESSEPQSRKKKPKKQASVSETRSIDFGIDAFNSILKLHGEEGKIPANLQAPSASLNAPVMLPAYVDVWCQTNPRPTPEPDVALFIHGPQSGERDVQVCWRADLVEDGHLNRSNWCDVVGLLPPTVAECMSVPISRLRRWLTEESDNPDQGDVLGVSDPTDAAADSKKGKAKPKKSIAESRSGVLWRGSKKGKSKRITSTDQLRPADTLVLPVRAGGWEELGHIPNSLPDTIDVAEIAFRAARDRDVLRLHPAMPSQYADSSAIKEILELLSDPENSLTQSALRQLLRQAADGFAQDHKDFETICRNLSNPKFGLIRENYPDERGCVLTTRRRIEQGKDWYLPAVDDGEDDLSRTVVVSLIDHTRHVCDEVNRTIAALSFDDLAKAFSLAADLHDLGKADERFQAMLRRTDRTDAWLMTDMDSQLLAKSDGMPQTRLQRQEARDRAGLPDGFRHEMLSVQITEQCKMISDEEQPQMLILHLIAAHHGFARPFAPVVIDADPPDVSVRGVTITTPQRKELPPHRLDSGIAERFWSLTHRFGWWGLAYLEAILRLSDQQASADEDAGEFDSNTSSLLVQVPK